MWWMRVSPWCSRVVPSNMLAPVVKWASQRFARPVRQCLQRPQLGTKARMTRSPTFRVVTPSPNSMTVPEPSWPSTAGVAMTPSFFM